MQRALFFVHLFIDAFSIHLSCAFASVSVFAIRPMLYYEFAQKCEQIHIHASHILTYIHTHTLHGLIFLKKGERKGKKRW